MDFVLEGLFAQKKITRSDDWHYAASEQPRTKLRVEEEFFEHELPGGGKKKYYN